MASPRLGSVSTWAEGLVVDEHCQERFGYPRKLFASAAKRGVGWVSGRSAAQEAE